MHKNRLWLLGIAPVCATIFLILLLALCLPTQFGETYLGELPEKLHRLQETDGERLIVIGGSSVPFALKSDLLEAEFPGKQVVDFGLYADLGTLPMLDFARSSLQDGDFVILMIEQDDQALSDFVGGEQLLQALDGHFHFLSALSTKRWGKILASLPGFAGSKLRYSLTESPKGEGVYAKSSFNVFGDIKYDNRDANIMSNGYLTNRPIHFDTSMLSQTFLNEIKAFVTYANQTGATVVWHFPPMNELALSEDVTISSIDAYCEMLRLETNLEILGNPHDMILDAGWFYDTNFHLNDSGSIHFTRLFAQELRAYWRDPSVVSISDVPIPALSASVVEGDDSDAAYFLARETEQGVEIYGLTEEGKLQTSLTIPTIYEEKVVTSLSAETF